MDTKTTKQLVKREIKPRLRFPEFREAGEWEIKALESFGVFIRGLTYTANDVSEHGLLVLRSSNIQDGSLKLKEDLVFVDKSCPDDLVLRQGDIIICMSNGSKSLVGKNAEYDGSYNGNLTIGAFCSLFRPQNNFVKFIFQTEQYSGFVSLSIGGGSINNLKNSVLEGFLAPIPSDVLEQQKIADFLSSLDELITAQSQKLDALKIHKKGLMQQLFPREGETVPRLRFPEFREVGEWNKDELGRIALFINERISLDQLSLASYVSTENILPDYEGLATASKLPSSGTATRFKTNDVLISNIRPYLKKICLANRDGGASNDVIVARAKEKVSYRYLSFILKSDAFIEYVMKSAKGVKMPRGDISLIKEYPLAYPSKLEQQKIADCLSSLDELITAQSQKLDALKTHKKGLMQQLFPVMDEVQR